MDAGDEVPMGVAERRYHAGFREAGVVAVHVAGARASGKTAWLEATARAITPGARLCVAAADLGESDRARLSAAGADVGSVTSRPGGVLDLEGVTEALSALSWRDAEYLFVESVPDSSSAALDFGQDLTVVVVPACDGLETAWPGLIRGADLVLLTKTDLGSDGVRLVRENLARVMNRPAMLPVSAVTGEGLREWVRWLRGHGQRRIAPCALGFVRM